MKNMVLLRAMGGIDEDLVERAAPQGRAVRVAAAGSRRRWGRAMAACLVAALAVALPLLLDAIHSREPAEVVLPDPSGSYRLHFNRATDRVETADRAFLPLMVGQELSAEEMAAIFPNLQPIRAVAQFFYFDSSFCSIGAEIPSASGQTGIVEIYREGLPFCYTCYTLERNAGISGVMGTPVTAGYYRFSDPQSRQEQVICFAEFQLGGLGYQVRLIGDAALEEELRKELSEAVGLLISGGAADISILKPEKPEGWRRDQLSLEEARADEAFGHFIPASVPEGYLFESASRIKDGDRDELSVCWLKGMGDLRWRVTFLGEEERARLTDASALKNYDLSLYPIPWCDSVPAGLREIVENPVFRIEELTPQVVERRLLEIDDAGDEPGTRLRFSVLYGEVVVEVASKGVPAEKTYEMLHSIGRS